jgi:glycosyltransferase involved in cell wall biosynthesis
MSSKTFAIVAYPLSQEFRRRLETSVAPDAAYISLPQLRRMQPREALTTLRSFAGRRCILPLEDPTTEAILPLLHTAAAVAGASEIEVVYSDFRCKALPRRALARGLASLAAASAAGQVARGHARLELRALLRHPRAHFPFPNEQRVVYVNPNLWIGLKAGGSIGHVAGVVNGLRESGLNVTLFSAAEPVLVGPEAGYERLLTPQSFAVPLEVNVYRFQRRLVDHVADAAPPSQFLYVRNTVGSYAGPMVSRRMRLPLVLEYNGSEVWVARHWGRPLRYESLAERAEETSLRHAHLVVTVSRVLRDELIQRGVEPERIVCYPNCVDEKLYDPARFGAYNRRALRREHRIPDDALVAAFIGTFGRWHGAEVFAAAAAQLVQTDEHWVRERRVRFLFVGDGVQMPHVRALVDDPRVAPYVTLTGLIPQQAGPQYLAAADLFISPHVANPDHSPFFGSPTKLFEYMAMARGIVASRLDQIEDVLSPAVSVAALPTTGPNAAELRLAVLASPDHVDELIAGLRFLIDNAEWRRRLGENARRRVLARYTWRHHVGAILEGFQRLRADASGE